MRMKRKSKEIILFIVSMVMSVAMSMSSSIAIYANETVQDPETAAEHNNDPDMLQIVLPTNAAGIFDFILDPQQLISQTNGAAYEGRKFEEGATLFFERFDGETEEDYSSTSDAVTFANKGSMPVEVLVTANIKASEPDVLIMTDDREFTDDISASLYLALTDGEMTVPILTEEGASIRGIIPAATEEGEGLYSFRLTGTANGRGDWSVMKNVGLEVTVTWIIVPGREETTTENENKNVETSDGEKENVIIHSTATEATSSSPSDTDVIFAGNEEENVELYLATPANVVTKEESADIKAVRGATDTEAASHKREGLGERN